MDLPSPPRRPTVTLTFDLPEYNQVINTGYWIFPVSFIQIVLVVHEILWLLFVYLWYDLYNK